jgi:ribose transport system substrate-binding protein
MFDFRWTEHGTALRVKVALLILGVEVFGIGCHNESALTIAVIPRTTGTALWEPAHAGAEIAARSTKTKIYWNAPTREDDVQGQIALVESVIDRGYQGLVLAPDQARALISPVRRALSAGIPAVIISSPLPLPAGGKLSYVVSDDEEAGQIAASRIGELLHRRGSIAVLGIDPDVIGIMTRARSLEATLAQNYPQIKIVDRRIGSSNLPHDQQLAEEILRANPNLDAIVALTWTSVHGTCTALKRQSSFHMKVVGFDDAPSVALAHCPELDSLITQNTHEMGQRAVQMIATQLSGQTVPSEIRLKPVLVTLKNLNSPEVQEILSMDWKLRP